MSLASSDDQIFYGTRCHSNRGSEPFWFLMFRQWFCSVMHYFTRFAISEDFFVPVVRSIYDAAHEIPLTGIPMEVIALGNFAQDLRPAVAMLRTSFDINGSHCLRERHMRCTRHGATLRARRALFSRRFLDASSALATRPILRAVAHL
jgi:hypothetical protein